jgi:hypothetical protein
MERRFNHNSKSLRWLIQQLLAVVIPFLWRGTLETAFNWSEVMSGPFSSTGVQIINAAAIVCIAFFIGINLRRTMFQDDTVGNWIWLLPSALLASGLIWELWIFRFDWSLIEREFFFWPRPGYDEPPILRDVLTYPALSCCAYSLGFFAAWRRSHEGKLGRSHI